MRDALDDFLAWIINEKRIQMLTATDSDRDRLDIEIRQAERMLEKHRNREL